MDISRHPFDVQWLRGDATICCNTLPGEAAGKPPAKESPSLRCAQGVPAPGRGSRSRASSRTWHMGHRSHASRNPDAVRQSEIPPNSRRNRNIAHRFSGGTPSLPATDPEGATETRTMASLHQSRHPSFVAFCRPWRDSAIHQNRSPTVEMVGYCRVSLAGQNQEFSLENRTLETLPFRACQSRFCSSPRF